MSHLVHGYVICCARSSVFAVNRKGCSVGGFLPGYLKTALAVLVPEIFGYTGTLNPHAIDMD